jgi:hypothetical protein
LAGLILQLSGLIAAVFGAAPMAGSVDAASTAEQLAALQARLQLLEDKEAIRELFNRYGFTADTGDAKGWSETWAEDGVFDGGKFTSSGREQFFKSIEDPDGVHKRDIEGKGSLHTTGGVTIRVDGLKAWAEGPTLVWVRDGPTFKVFSMAYNHWDLQKNNGRWEMVRRIARSVAPTNAAKVFKAYQTAD